MPAGPGVLPCLWPKSCQPARLLLLARVLSLHISCQMSAQCVSFMLTSAASSAQSPPTLKGAPPPEELYEVTTPRQASGPNWLEYNINCGQH